MQANDWNSGFKCCNIFFVFGCILCTMQNILIIFGYHNHLLIIWKIFSYNTTLLWSSLINIVKISNWANHFHAFTKNFQINFLSIHLPVYLLIYFSIWIMSNVDYVGFTRNQSTTTKDMNTPSQTIKHSSFGLYTVVLATILEKTWYSRWAL